MTRSTAPSWSKEEVPRITIRLAAESDLQYLPAIEASASNLFQSLPELSFIAADSALSINVLSFCMASRHLWVAVDEHSSDGKPVGFLAAEYIRPRAKDGEVIDNISRKHLYIMECSVHPSFQRQGIASRLFNAVEEYAREEGFGWLTLVTFLDVSWNGRFYRKLGYAEVDAQIMGDEYVDILNKEKDQWKDWESKTWRRGVMARKTL